MPLILLLLALLVILALMMVLVPLSIVQRYRAGTARRPARGWLAMINVFGFGLSSAMIVTTAAISSVWVSGTLGYTAAGLAAGGLLACLGLWLTRWENRDGSLHYTPNRWLVLAISLAVAFRLGLGLWRAWQAWQTRNGDESWLESAGFGGSLAAAALVLGYYLIFWAGIWFRIRNHRKHGTNRLGF